MAEELREVQPAAAIGIRKGDLSRIDMKRLEHADGKTGRPLSRKTVSGSR
jgi:hypothetical protein